MLNPKRINGRNLIVSRTASRLAFEKEINNLEAEQSL
jgi:hypothetical protein